MPTTRKKIIKTVYKDEESEDDEPFSDSGSEAKISEVSSSEDETIIEEDEEDNVSGDDFRAKSKKKIIIKKDLPPIRRRKPKFAKDLVTKINNQVTVDGDDDNELPTPQFSLKDLTAADKLLPSFLNLSESDSSDDESQTKPEKNTAVATTSNQEQHLEKYEDNIEYRDVWSNNVQDDSEYIAKRTFLELEKHKTEIEQTKASVDNYVSKTQANLHDVSRTSAAFNVNDLLAQGEEVIKEILPKKKVKARRRRDNSESDIEDWEEVNEAKSIPQQGLQLFVEFPDAPRKSKKLDIEMMMKRKINRVKKENQVFMHQVHVLCWIGHGNYVNHVLNDQEIMAAALAMVPKGCYPEERVTTKYVEQITTWFKDKLTFIQDKNEHKFRPKAPPLRNILLDQMKRRVTTAKKYNVFIFVAMLRALGLQCRVMFNFVTLPIRPPSFELCSLSIKKENPDKPKENILEKSAEKGKKSTLKAKCSKKIAQVDGAYDTFSESDRDHDNIMQLDGNDDTQVKSRSTRSTRAKRVETNNEEHVKEGVSPPKRAKKDDSLVPDQAEPKGKAVKSTGNQKKKNKTANDIADNNEKLKADLKSNLPPKSPKSPIRKRSVRNPETKLNNTENDSSKSPQGKQHSSKNPNRDDMSKEINKTVKSINKPDAPKPQARSRSNSSKNDTELAENVKAKKKQATSKSKNIFQETKNQISKDSQKKDTKESALSSKSLSSKTVPNEENCNQKVIDALSLRKTRSKGPNTTIDKNVIPKDTATKKIPTITVINENQEKIESEFFTDKNKPKKRMSLSRKRSHLSIAGKDQKLNDTKTISRTRSAPGTSTEKSKYFESEEIEAKKPKLNSRQTKKEQIQYDKLRVSHKDLKQKAKPTNDVTEDLVDIIKNRIKVEKAVSKKGIVKGKVKEESGEDSDFLPVEDVKTQNYSDEDFKPTKISPRPPKLAAKIAKKLDRRVLSSDDEIVKQNKVNVWCEVFVEELEQWIAVDVIKGKVHCTNDIYTNSTHPVCYIVGWDNNNYLKDLTRRYVPHWNTVTRKQRASPDWWRTAIQPWVGPRSARDREEDEQLDRLQLEAPLPKSIAEYKNHPLYALKRHLLKFEALYPPEATTLGFVRGEAVYSRDCVYTCQSRDKWLKEAKVVKLGEQPYKIVKARPKWDKLSNKCITDKPLEVFGLWQTQDYEPPTAENGIVPRNPYGNVELFKPCMLPKKTVHMKLNGLHKVAKKLNIDCSPAITGFDFNGGFSHPVYDGYVVCEEFEEILTDAWLKDQEDQERKELEKLEQRVYGNWRRLIRGLMIRERLKLKYGFEEPTTSQPKPKKGPRLVVRKK